MQAKRNNKKGCMLFAMKISSDEKVCSDIENEESEMLKIYLVW